MFVGPVGLVPVSVAGLGVGEHGEACWWALLGGDRAPGFATEAAGGVEFFDDAEVGFG